MSTKDKKIQETIKVKNSYFEGCFRIGPRGQPIFSPAFQGLLNKNIFPEEFKPRYWLGRALDRITQEINSYVKAKQSLVRIHTKKHEKAGERKNPDGSLTRWKKGDPVLLENGEPDWIDYEAYINETNQLMEIEVDLGICRIAFDPDKGPDAIGQEMLLLLPLLEEKIQDISVPAKKNEKAAAKKDNVMPFKKK